VGYLVAGPLADAWGARTVLGVGSVIGGLLLLAGLLPRSTRELGLEPQPGGPGLEPQPSISRAMSR
jgi:MFS family permease